MVGLNCCPLELGEGQKGGERKSVGDMRKEGERIIRTQDPADY